METSNSFERLIETLWERKILFFAAFAIIGLLTYALLAWVDFLPEPRTVDLDPQATSENSVALGDSTTAFPAQEIEVVSGSEDPAAEPVEVFVAPVLPNSIFIPATGKTIPVLNPNSRSVADLDAALLNGVVRHPDSATLESEGNVFILGHSSYLPNVFNEYFQAFNGIQDLEWGDEILVTANGETYVYVVDRVFEARASEVTIPLVDTGRRLTLATCDSFGSVEDRFIVEASFDRIDMQI
jgi:LPXTG-site transpeptidase (sortase) family protein